MAVSIRLRRMGRKKQPHYRVVVAESEFARDGRFVESLGYYKPLTNPARLVLDLERVDYWISKGAQPSGTVKSLIGKARRGGGGLVLGHADVQAEKAQRSEMLAERRAAEKRKAEAAAAKSSAAAPAVVPQEVAEVPGGSSAEDGSGAGKAAEGSASGMSEDGAAASKPGAAESADGSPPAKKARKPKKEPGTENA